MNGKDTHDTDTRLIDLETARALVARGYAVVPTESDAEKRPKARFSTAKSWRDFSDRLPTDAELVEWFGPRPRRGGIALHKGQLCIDHDTKDVLPAEGRTCATAWEESDHGWHEFYRCAEDVRIQHDHVRKIDCLVYGSFVRLCAPRCLLDWQGELPMWSAADAPRPAAGRGTLLAMLESQGWKVGARQSNGWFSLVNGTKTAALSADGSVLKMFSTTMCESPQEPPAPPPAVVSARELAGRGLTLAEPVLSFCRRGSFALVSGDPKAGKTTLALKICAKKAAAGYRCLYADFENGPELFCHRLGQSGFDCAAAGDNLFYLDCRFAPTIDHIAAAMDNIGGIDLLVIDCWGLLIAGDGVEDESSNALVSAYFLKVRRTLAAFDAATVILHHTPKSGANEKLCFAGAGASSLQRYVQTIARISEDKAGAHWFNAICREFDEPFRPVLMRRAAPACGR